MKNTEKAKLFALVCGSELPKMNSNLMQQKSKNNTVVEMDCCC